MRKLLLVIISVFFIIECEDKKDDSGLQGEVIIDDYFTYMNEVDIKYRVINTGRKDIYGWIVSFKAVMDNGVQYTLNDSVQKTRSYDYYTGEYFYGYTPGDTSQKYIASTPTPYTGVQSASVKSVIFKAEGD